MKKLFLLTLAITSNSFAESPWKEFSGLYHIDKAPIYDPKEPLEERTHLYLALQGDPAEELYNQIEGEPILSKCGIDHLYKSVGNIRCLYYQSQTKYSCEFSINIKEGIVAPAGWC